MRKEIIGTLAIVGAVATFAALNINSLPNQVSFLGDGPTTEYEHAFIEFISKYHKSYGTKEEYNYRLQVFSKNFHDIKSHNMMNAVEHGYSKSINKFTDLTPEEFKKMLGFRKEMRQQNEAPVILNVTGLPDSVDWRSKGAVTPVKNQGQCGSCWAFSTTGSLEGLNQIKNGQLISFSEQQLVDCSTAEGNQGCNGGLMDQGFEYAEKTSIETESDYPYTATDGKCHVDSSKGKFKISGFQDVAENDPAQLQAAVAQQPVSVAIEADTMTFQSYSSGIISSTACGTNLDHGVLVVGYGSEGGKDYWILKNSWGPDWGEQGFFRIARDMNSKGPGICGLQESASYPTL